MVLATQNPIEQEGTYPLPEAQMDRFMFKVTVDYPQRDDELKILRRMATSAPDCSVRQVATPEDIKRLRRLVDTVFMDGKVEEYIVNLVDASRHPEKYGLKIGDLIRYGASPRATIYLAMAAKACAMLQGRGFATPQDVKTIAPDVLRHRIIPTYEAEAEEVTSDELVRRLLDTIEVP
jgi:MoxR-like ATPase